MEKKENETFESSVKKLEVIINELESGELDLDKSISKYTEAMKLIENCESKLSSATETINKLVEKNGKITDFEIVGIGVSK